MLLLVFFHFLSEHAEHALTVVNAEVFGFFLVLLLRRVKFEGVFFVCRERRLWVVRCSVVFWFAEFTVFVNSS